MRCCVVLRSIPPIAIRRCKELTAELTKGTSARRGLGKQSPVKQRFLAALSVSFLVICLGVLLLLSGAAKTDLRPALLSACAH